VAGGLTPDQEWALRKAHGSLDNARDEAIERSSELRELWVTWWPRTPAFWEAFWKRALPVLGLDAAPPEEHEPKRTARRRHRPPDQLLYTTVQACETKLKERRKAGKRVPHDLTYEQIGLDVGFPRDRVRQLEGLMKKGWPLRRSHPDFSADEGYVRLPSVSEAASLLRSH
jgi:hypothetical protein